MPGFKHEQAFRSRQRIVGGELAGRRDEEIGQSRRNMHGNPNAPRGRGGIVVTQGFQHEPVPALVSSDGFPASQGRQAEPESLETHVETESIVVIQSDQNC